VVVILSTSAVATPEAVTDPGVETDLVPEVETDLVPGVVVTDLVQVAVVTDPVPEQDQARDKNQVLGQDLAREQDRVRLTRVPLVAKVEVEVLHQGTVNVVRRAAPVNHAQEVHRAEVVVDAAVPVVVVDVVVAVAEAVAADVDVDLRWRLKTPKQPHRTIE